MENFNQSQAIKKERHQNALKWILVVGILVVLNLFFNFATKLVYDAPKYEDFCTPKQINIAPENQEACIAEGGGWNENTYPKIERPTSEPLGYCDIDFTCRQEFSDSNSVYNRNVFIILVILGIASVVSGMFI